MKYSNFRLKKLTKQKGQPYQVRIRYKDPITGNWKEGPAKTLGVMGIREAKRLGQAYLDEMNKAADNAPTLKHELTIGEAVTDFLEHQERTGEIEGSTYIHQKWNFNRYIKPYIGDYEFATFDKVGVSNWLTKLYGLELSGSTIRLSFTIVRKVYNYYYLQGDIIRNPFDGIKKPQQGKPRTTHLTKEQMDEYLAALYADYNPEDKYFAAFGLLFYSGLRRGEVAGLRWRDINFTNNTLTVETSIGIREGGGYTKQTKNPSSTRTFPMVPQLREILLSRYEAIEPKSNWFVCGEEDNYIYPGTLGAHFRDFTRKNNLVDAYGKPLIPHGMRHNLGYVGINSGMDVASLAKMFGHAKISTALNIYGDSSKEAMEVATERLGNAFDNNSEYFKMVDIYDKSDTKKEDEI